jgi:phosphohistidine phosphatase
LQIEASFASASRVPDSIERVMVVGHNPGMQLLVGRLTGHSVTFPTAALAMIEMDIDRWADVEDARGTLVSLSRRRELDE